MSAPLCEAVLDVPGSGAVLADLARSNLLLVPLDRRGHWYRYHHLFRDMLLAELERLESELVPLQGVARLLSGDLDGAERFLDEGIDIAEVGSIDTRTALLCERSLVAMARNLWDQAEKLAAEARSLLLDAGAEDPLACAVAAKVAIHRGDVLAARRELVNAQRLRHLFTYATPHLAVQGRIELARVHLTLADLAGARTLMGEIDDLLSRRPGLGTLVAEARELRAQLALEHGPSVPGASALTTAELRLLPMLATHLSVPEIATELFLSPHTIKSQMKSIYRKLESTSRTQTVTRARDLGLLEG